MGDSSRRRSTMWDVEGDRRPFTDRGRYREYPPLSPNNILRPKEHSRWSSWEEKDDHIAKDEADIFETRERLQNNSYYRSMSPGFDGLGQQNWSNSPDKQWSQSRRYTVRRRSRSRGREKSRSRSRGWSRGRNRPRDWSRSRSRSRGSLRGHSRSRSPFHIQGRESNRWSDKRSEIGRLSQTCRDFSAGMCRKGSQCRFLHQDNAIPRDDGRLDNDLAGRWKGKQEPSRGSKYHYDRCEDKLSDAYYKDSEQLRNRTRGAVTCRDFINGNCRYGAACRFSHHGASEYDNSNRSIRNVAADGDHERHQNKGGRTLCKFFLAGKCQRDNCRFSHDAPKSSGLEDRTHDNSGGTGGASLDKWKGPLWDELARPSNTRTISGWGEGDDADMKLSEDIDVGQGRDERWGRNLEDESKVWGHGDKGINRDKYHSSPRRNDDNGGAPAAAKAMVTESSLGEPGLNLISRGFKSHAVDRLSPRIQSQNPNEEASKLYLPTSSTHPMVSINSDIHQEGVADHNTGLVLGSGALYEVKDSRNSNGHSINPDSRCSFPMNTSVLKETGQNLPPISNAIQVDLNGSGQHFVFPVNVQHEEQRQQESTEPHMQQSSLPYSFPAPVPNEQVAPLTAFPPPAPSESTPPLHFTKNFLDELKNQLHTVLESSNPPSIAASANAALPVPVDYTLNISDSTRSLDQLNFVKNDTGIAGNSLPPDSSVYLKGQENQKPKEMLSSLSMNNPDLGNFHQSGGSGVEGNDGSKVKQHEAMKKLDARDNDGKCYMGSKIEPENICSVKVDGQGKEEGGNSNKDDKGMRLFKNALVEFVKEILKPNWKEGRMSREVHKTVVKKVVDKVTGTLQGEHALKTQEKIEQYLSSNKPKITKLVQAYAERARKADS